MSKLSLSDRDKTPATSGWGHHFHHTDPQRRGPCVLGDMLAPLSADDIPPITPEAMASVQAALTLLADLIGDRDHGRFLGCNDAQLEEYRQKARDILSTARALTGILRVTSNMPMADAAPTALTATPPTQGVAASTTAVEDLKRALEGLTTTPTHGAPMTAAPEEPSQHQGDPMRKISLSAIRAARGGMTTGKYTFALGPLNGVYVIAGKSHQVAMMTFDAPSADPGCPDVPSQPRHNALGFAVMTNHIGVLIEIAEAALAARAPITDEESARAQFQAGQRLDTVLTRVAR